MHICGLESGCSRLSFREKRHAGKTRRKHGSMSLSVFLCQISDCHDAIESICVVCVCVCVCVCVRSCGQEQELKTNVLQFCTSMRAGQTLQINVLMYLLCLAVDQKHFIPNCSCYTVLRAKTNETFTFCIFVRPWAGVNVQNSRLVVSVGILLHES